VNSDLKLKTLRDRSDLIFMNLVEYYKQSQLQLSTGGTPLLLQPPVNFVTDQIGLGQLISQAAATQNQQNLQNMMNLGNVMNPPLQMSEGGSSGTTPKQRVFTGTVTKIHDNFGFIDEEVFFSMQ